MDGYVSKSAQCTMSVQDGQCWCGNVDAYISKGMQCTVSIQDKWCCSCMRVGMYMLHKQKCAVQCLSRMDEACYNPLSHDLFYSNPLTETEQKVVYTKKMDSDKLQVRV